mmetsp:Transcript_9879/g.32361  ORF Transcript_9879/g.32361 Transcript_9879/m.32361 type:complete len:225 (-) Transcript_9879:55-729(-)
MTEPTTAISLEVTAGAEVEPPQTELTCSRWRQAGSGGARGRGVPPAPDRARAPHGPSACRARAPPEQPRRELQRREIHRRRRCYSRCLCRLSDAAAQAPGTRGRGAAEPRPPSAGAADDADARARGLALRNLRQFSHPPRRRRRPPRPLLAVIAGARALQFSCSPQPNRVRSSQCNAGADEISHDAIHDGPFAGAHANALSSVPFGAESAQEFSSWKRIRQHRR